MPVDWGTGRYELIAADLAPAAAVVVDRARVRPGERALDLGCGSGNAALELARAGATVTAVDPAVRLLEVTSERARSAGVIIDVRRGDAASIPLPDGSVDLIVSVFAVFLAPDPTAAVAEMARVLAPGGRMLLTAWVPGAGIGKAYAALGPVVAAATGIEPAERFPWHDTATLEALAQPHGLSVAVEQRSITFSAESPEAQVQLDTEHHPVWLDTIAQLAAAGADAAVARDAALNALHEVNEDPSAFRATSHYVIATLR
ncbi:MAG TPA: class I SAM-dependent methyltransferase [Mycobacteriales bacterium]|nr:class I SAM-dependent methyltransferase [Mycobacteriales bacterium]